MRRRGPGSDEIDITPDMLKAGVAALWAWYDGDEDGPVGARGVYQAMVQAQGVQSDVKEKFSRWELMRVGDVKLEDEPMPQPRVIAPALIAWRKANRLTELEAAERLGVPVANYRLWEAGSPCSFPALVENAIGIPVALKPPGSS